MYYLIKERTRREALEIWKDSGIFDFIVLDYTTEFSTTPVVVEDINWLDGCIIHQSNNREDVMEHLVLEIV